MHSRRHHQGDDPNNSPSLSKRSESSDSESSTQQGQRLQFVYSQPIRLSARLGFRGLLPHTFDRIQSRPHNKNDNDPNKDDYADTTDAVCCLNQAAQRFFEFWQTRTTRCSLLPLRDPLGSGRGACVSVCLICLPYPYTLLDDVASRLRSRSRLICLPYMS